MRKGGLALFIFDLTILFKNTSVHILCACIHKITQAKCFCVKQTSSNLIFYIDNFVKAVRI